MQYTSNAKKTIIYVCGPAALAAAASAASDSATSCASVQPLFNLPESFARLPLEEGPLEPFQEDNTPAVACVSSRGARSARPNQAPLPRALARPPGNGKHSFVQRPNRPIH